MSEARGADPVVRLSGARRMWFAVVALLLFALPFAAAALRLIPVSTMRGTALTLLGTVIGVVVAYARRPRFTPFLEWWHFGLAGIFVGTLVSFVDAWVRGGALGAILTYIWVPALRAVAFAAATILAIRARDAGSHMRR